MGPTVRLDVRWLIIALLTIALGVITYLWRPWSDKSRTITVTGVGIVQEQPNEFTFNPYVEREAKSANEAIAAATLEGQNLITKLKELGVQENKITTSINSGPKYSPTGAVSDMATASYYLTIVTTDRTVADKVQGYLATAGVQGSITPMSTFSTESQNNLEKKARTKAISDAKDKAKQTASAYNAKIGKVISVNDEDDRDYPFPYMSSVSSMDSAGTGKFSSESVMTGDVEYRKSVKVVYQLK